MVGRDLDEDDEADCFDDRLPAADDSNLPEWAKGKTYFGKPSVYDGYVYEDEYSYLQRLDLLFAEEKAIFKVRLYDHCVRRSAGRARKMRAVLGVGA